MWSTNYLLILLFSCATLCARVVESDQETATKRIVTNEDITEEEPEDDTDKTEVDFKLCKQVNGETGYCQDRESCESAFPDVRVWAVCKWAVKFKRPKTLCCNKIDSKEDNEESDNASQSSSPSLTSDEDGLKWDCGKILPSRFKRQNRYIMANKSHITAGNYVPNIRKYPWQVALFSRGCFMCGGSIISPTVVATAAHCYNPERQHEYTVRVGALRPEDGQEYKVEQFINHELYAKPQHYHDIALLKIQGTFKFSDEIKPVCLPNANYNTQVLVNKIVTVTGFGTTKFGGSRAETLQEADVAVVSNEVCTKAYARVSSHSVPHGITDAFVCAGFPDGGQDACQGDSGGPLVVQHKGRSFLVGIVSFGYKCGEPGFPGVYTNVALYVKWIQDQGLERVTTDSKAGDLSNGVQKEQRCKLARTLLMILWSFIIRPFF